MVGWNDCGWKLVWRGKLLQCTWKLANVSSKAIQYISSRHVQTSHLPLCLKICLQRMMVVEMVEIFYGKSGWDYWPHDFYGIIREIFHNSQYSSGNFSFLHHQPPPHPLSSCPEALNGTPLNHRKSIHCGYLLLLPSLSHKCKTSSPISKGWSVVVGCRREKLFRWNFFSRRKNSFFFSWHRDVE